MAALALIMPLFPGRYVQVRHSQIHAQRCRTYRFIIILFSISSLSSPEENSTHRW